MHMANTVDIAYERGWGWIKVVIFSIATAFTISGFEHYTDWNLWESTGDWARLKLREWAQSILNR